MRSWCVVEEFRQLSFAEAQLSLALTEGAVVVDLSVPGVAAGKFMVLNVSAAEFVAALSAAEFLVEASTVGEGWWRVQVEGLSPEFAVVEVILGSSQVGLN